MQNAYAAVETTNTPRDLNNKKFHIPPQGTMNTAAKGQFLERLAGVMRASLPCQISATLLAQLLGTLHKQNFLVLTSARCGSNLLVDFINCHWRIVCHREILNDGYVTYGHTSTMPKWRKRLHIKSFFLKVPCLIFRMPRQFVGIKALHDQFDAYGVELSTIFRDVTFRKVICLYRQDLLETYVSLKIAEATDGWYSTSETNAISVDVDADEFVEYCMEHRRLWAKCAAQIPEHCDIHFLSYEALVQDPATQMKRVFEFIGPRYNRCPVAKSVRQNPAPISDKVINYQALLAGGTRAAELRFFELPRYINQTGESPLDSTAFTSAADVSETHCAQDDADHIMA